MFDDDLSLPARFWSKVNKDGPVHPYNPELGKCWVWTAGCQRGGYGAYHIRREDSSWTTTKPHRLTLAARLGRPIAPDMDAMHSCDNPPCVNPDHLSEGTQQENVTDCVNKGRRFDVHKREIQHNNKSGYKGVNWHKASGSWTAQIMVNYNKIYLGVFSSLQDAIIARKAGEEKYWGTK